MRRKKSAAGQDSRPADRFGPPPPLPTYTPSDSKSRPNFPVNARLGDDSGETPPWERESGRIPVPPIARTRPSAPPPVWDFESVGDLSLPGIEIGNTMTGTGKIAAIVPLATGESWSKGVRAPRGAASVVEPIPSEVEVDEQPSAQMRALRVGNLARATAIVTAAILLSRVLGLLRTSLFAYAFGTTYWADAFTNAFTVPDAIFNIVAGGALASAFIPVFADYLIDKRDRKTAWHVASSALNISMLALTLLAIVGFIFAPQFLNLQLHPLFVNHNPEGPLVIKLTRIMLLQPIFLGGATVAVSVLQARQYFVLPAIAQVVYTASLVAGIGVTLLDHRYGIVGHRLDGYRGIYGPAAGVVAGALLQLLIQIPGLMQAKMEYHFSFDFFHPGVREMFRLMAPRLINAAFLYISVFINRALLVTLGITIAVYGYVTAFSLVMLPIGVFGMAVSQAAFPTLAALVSAGEWRRLSETIMRTIRGVTYLAVPSSLGLIVLADPICRLVLAHGRNFDVNELGLFSQPLIYFAIGLLGLSLVEILTRSFYALHDSRTAVEVSVLQFMFVIGLSIILLKPMGASGLALATSLGSLGEALVLLLLLRPRIGAGMDLKGFWVFLLNVLAASVVSALAALFVYTLGKVVLPVTESSLQETVKMAVRVLAAMLAACVVYFGFARFLGIDDVVPLSRIARRVLRR